MIIFAVATFISYGLQGYVPVAIIWGTYLSKRFENSPKKLHWELLVRILIVLATCKHSLYESNVLPYINFSCTLISPFGCVNSTFGSVYFAVRRPMPIGSWSRFPRSDGNLRFVSQQIRTLQLHSLERHFADYFRCHWTGQRNVHQRSGHHPKLHVKHFVNERGLLTQTTAFYLKLNVNISLFEIIACTLAKAYTIIIKPT